MSGPDHPCDPTPALPAAPALESLAGGGAAGHRPMHRPPPVCRGWFAVELCLLLPGLLTLITCFRDFTAALDTQLELARAVGVAARVASRHPRDPAPVRKALEETLSPSRLDPRKVRLRLEPGPRTPGSLMTLVADLDRGAGTGLLGRWVLTGPRILQAGAVVPVLVEAGETP